MIEKFKLYSLPRWYYIDAIEKENLDVEIPFRKLDSIVNIEHNRIAFFFLVWELKNKLELNAFFYCE